jgi:hypothetical protein
VKEDKPSPPAGAEPSREEEPRGPAPGQVSRYSSKVQRKARGAADPGQVQRAAARGVAGSGTELPHSAKIQESFGHHDVSGVMAHVGGEAATAVREMNAVAYATGDDVAFGAAPDLHTSAHEAAHVVQQRSGVSLKGGVGAAGDRYEQNADAVADRVVAGHSAVDLLDSIAPWSGRAGDSVQKKSVQMRGPDEAGEGDSDSAGAGGDSAKDKGSPGEAEEDTYEGFAGALKSFEPDKAKTIWGKLSTAEKAKLKDDLETGRRVVWRLKKDPGAKILSEAGHDLEGLIHAIFLADDFEHWRAALKANGLFDNFIDKEPKRWLVSDAYAKKLQSWIGTAPGADAAKIFEKVYPKLNNSAKYPSSEKALAWNLYPSLIRRLYNAISQHTPVGHAQTITGGFSLINQHLDGGKWKTLGYGWWEPTNFRCVMPYQSGTTTANTGHGMTGGAGSGADNTYQVDDGAGGTAAGANASMPHFDTTALHEVGHGVGQRIGGNDYALDPSSYPQFHDLDLGEFANDLWSFQGGMSGGGSEPTVHSDAKLDAGDAKEFLKQELQGGKNAWSSWTNDASRADIAQWVQWKYGGVRLTQFWKKLVDDEDRKQLSSAYQWDDPAIRIKGDWVYSVLTRWNRSAPWAKFHKDAWDNKVSWYSLSSPKEWFAEQYAHYYRTEKTGGSQIDSSTKSLLDKLDKQAFIADDTGTGGRVHGSSRGEDSSGADDTGDRATSGEEAPAEGAEVERRPLLFPW